MKCKKLIILLLFVSSSVFSTVSTYKVHTLQELCDNILKNSEDKNWAEVFFNTKLLFKYHADSESAPEMYYYHGLACYNLKYYELAAESFSKYLQMPIEHKFFDEAINYQYQIASSYNQGGKKPIFGIKKMPKLLSAHEDAVKIYDQVIKTMPNHELAAKSLYEKAEILYLMEEYKDSIDSLQLLIQRFPKHDRTLDAYVLIGKVYLAQCNDRHQDINLLDLAFINLQRFESAFPKEEDRILLVKEMISKMEEIFADSFLEIAKFYDRTKKINAAKIYYSKIAKSFPNTKSAKISNNRLLVLETKK